MGCSSTKGAKPSSIKIYMMPVSQNAVGSVLLAMDLGVGEGEVCDLMSGAHKKPEYLAIHPYGQIPGLKDGGFCLGESSAIMRYLALAYGQKYYPPGNPQLCGKIDFAMDAFGMVYKKHTAIVYTVLGLASAPEDQAKANEEYTDAINKWFDIHIKDRKFVGGDYLTIADFKVAPFFYSAIQPVMKEKLGFEPPPRAVRYCKDFMGAVAASKFFQEAGGYSIKEFCASKGSPDAKPLEDAVPGSSPVAQPIVSPPSTQQKPSSPIKIYMMPVSQNAVGSVLLAMDLGVGQGEVCDLMSGAHKKPEYLAIHPYGQIPGLKDGNFCLGESSAVLRYQALAYGQKYYPPGNPQLCGKIDFAMDAFSMVYKKHTAIVYTVLGIASAPEDQAKANQEYTDAIKTWFDIHIKDGKFVGGNELTIADFKVAPFFYAAIQPVMKAKVGFVPPPRAVQYCEDFKAKTPTASNFLDSAGGYSIKEFCASKEKEG